MIQSEHLECTEQLRQTLTMCTTLKILCELGGFTVHLQLPPNDQQRLGLALCFLLAALDREVSEITGHTVSLALSTNLLRPNKNPLSEDDTKHQPAGHLPPPPPPPPSVPPPLWSKRLSESHFSLFAAMLEAR